MGLKSLFFHILGVLSVNGNGLGLGIGMAGDGIEWNGWMDGWMIVLIPWPIDRWMEVGGGGRQMR